MKQTALHIASANNHVDVMRILLNQGMSVDAKDQVRLYDVGGRYIYD